MIKVYNLITLLFLFFSVIQSQIIIDGNMSDWAGIDPWDQDPANEPLGDVYEMYQPHFDLMDVYATHDDQNLYVRIDIDPAGSFSEIFNYSNPPVFYLYMDTEIADTAGFDWGWWNIAVNYYIDLAASLHPDSQDGYAFLYKYTGCRIPSGAEGECEWLNAIPVGINDAKNALEFSVPRYKVNFGTEFRMFIHYVADGDSINGVDNLPDPWAEYMLKYDFVDGALVYQHLGEQINSQITIDGDLSDWKSTFKADIDEVAEELGDMPTGPEFDIQDVYITSDSTYLYMRVDITPTAKFSDIFTKYENYSAIQVFFETNWGGYTGIGYYGSWKLAPDYLIDFWDVVHPDTGTNMAYIARYIGNYEGENEEWEPIGKFAIAAVNEDDNAIEFAIPRSAINVDTDVRPFFYFVGNSIWSIEDYWPNWVSFRYGPPPYYCYNYNFISGGSIKAFYDPVAVEKKPEIEPPKNYVLLQNYPNPFNPSTTIKFQIPNFEFTTLKIYDILGKEVSTLISKKLNPGTHTCTFDGKNLASGVYIYRLVAESGFCQSRKFILLK